MKIEDALMFIPRVLYSTVLKIPRFELNERIKDECVKQGFYHFVKDESIADTIINSGHLRPSNAITSYGKPCAFLFCGKPDIENYAKNLSTEKEINNPYITPTMVSDAIKFKPQNRQVLNNYKFRGILDGAIMYEGYCILPKDDVHKVKMVPDLVRDDNGNPIKDNNGEYTVAFREAKEDELNLPDKKTYNAKDDYLQYMYKKAKEYGYLKENGNRLITAYNKTFSIADFSRMESNLMNNNVNSNIKDIVFNFFSRIKNLGIEQSPKDILEAFSFNRKNPYRNKEFSLYVARIQQEEGIVQYDLNKILPEFNNSKAGYFFQKKYNNLKDNITRKGIHGKEHSKRVSFLSMMIAEKEGILENDKNDRKKDILLTAAMYHDIGRILDIGPHAKRGARKVEKMNLLYSDFSKYTENDKKIVMALIESHEGKPDKINSVIKKLGIHDPEDIKLTLELNSIIRDADALDRVRLDQNNIFNYKPNLNPNFLVNKTSKALLNVSYQLEYLTKKIPNVQNIFSIGKKTNESNAKSLAKEFAQKIRVESKSQIQNRTNAIEKKIIERDDFER